MPNWMGSPQVDVQLRYSTHTGSPESQPSFSGNERISGEALFKPKKNYEGLRYRIVVKGNVQTKTGENINETLNANSGLETHTFYSSVLFDGIKAVGQNGDSKTEARVPFSFVLQRPDDFETNLLPSVESKSGGRHLLDAFKTNARAEYQITYTVIASALIDKKVVASVPGRFLFTPDYSPESPVEVEDFPGEYVVRTSKTLPQGSTTTRVGVISQEPAALSLDDQGEPTTDLNLLFMVVRDNMAAKIDPKTYSIQAHLVTNTFVLPQKSRPALHTLRGIAHSRAVVKQSKSHLQTYTAKFKSWECHDTESDDGKSTHGDEILTNSITVPFTLEDKDHQLVPNFWSPLLSRRYTIELSVTVDDDPNTLSKLRLPVQIFHERRP